VPVTDRSKLAAISRWQYFELIPNLLAVVVGIKGQVIQQSTDQAYRGVSFGL